MKEQIVSLKNELVSQIISSGGIKELEELETAYLARNGKLTTLIKELKNVSENERKEIGILINNTKQTILTLLAEQKIKFTSTKSTWFDPTVPGIKPKVGTKHLVTQAIDDIAAIFEKIGFVRS